MPDNRQIPGCQGSPIEGERNKFVSATNITSLTSDVACLGELVIDMVPAIEADGRATYEPKAGGAPGNVAVGLARLGKRVAMLAKVGDEAFGNLLIDTLARHGVDTSGIVRTGAHRTSLAFVVLGPEGERDFLFYRDNAADLFMAEADLLDPVIAGASVLHVNTVMLLGEVSRRAQQRAIALAAASDRRLSVDINFRRSLWRDQTEMLALGRDLVVRAAILKVTEDELRELSAAASIVDCVRAIWHPGLELCAVTKGAAGAELFTAAHHLSCDGFSVKSIDTTGAGDAFAACLLAELTEMEFDFTSDRRLALALRLACAAGALSTTRKGGMESMASQAEIDALLHAQNR
jgi:fructokinase